MAYKPSVAYKVDKRITPKNKVVSTKQVPSKELPTNEGTGKLLHRLPS